MPELSFHGPEHTLRAGGIATDLPPDDDARIGTAHARAYRHAAMRDRVVVRIESDAMSRGADAEMDVLGFSLADAGSALGRVRVRAAGFPAWALIHMPQLARFALEVTRDFKKAEKRAFSKPGHARDDFEAIATRLGRSVPAFLPSFWEEVGRVYLRADSTTYAAQSFERARRAEKEFALEVDGLARDAAFLEFSLAGAVAVKSLVAYAKELETSDGAESAYTRFRELAVRRCLGGLPPWASMVKDLRALAKRAGRDLDAEDDALVRELLGSQALSQAPGDFFESLRPAIVRLASSSPEAKTRIATIFPSGSLYGLDAERDPRGMTYLKLLEEVGVFARFATCPVESLPAGGLGAWVTRLLEYGSRAGARDIVNRALDTLAPRLRELGESVVPVYTQRYQRRLSIDVAERLLALGVELTVDPKQRWLTFSFDEPFEMDPVRVADHPVLGPLLATAVHASFGTALERRAEGKRGLKRAREQWIRARVDAVASGSLYDASISLSSLTSSTRATTFEEFTELRRALADVDFVSLLRDSLRLGFPDELGWPEFEAASLELGGNITFDGAFPYLVVRSSVRAICVGPSGRIVEHDFVLDPARESVICVRYVDGTLLVLVRDKTDYKSRGYYAHAPNDRFEVTDYYGAWDDDQNGVVLADGGTSFGGRAMRRGDRSLALSPFLVLSSDGRDLFVRPRHGEDVRFKQVDPATGKDLREGRPTFLEIGASEGKLLEASSFVIPIPGAPERATHPCDGLLGLRVVQTPSAIRATSMDGLAIDAAPFRPSLLLRFPGEDGASMARGSQGSAYRRPPNVTILSDARGRSRGLPPCVKKQDESIAPFSVAHRRVGLLPPRAFAFAAARDANGSSALRNASRADAEALHAAAKPEVDASEGKNDFDVALLVETSKTVARRFPAITNADLRSVVALAASHAVRLERMRDALLAREVEAAPAASVATTTGSSVHATITSLLAADGQLERPALSFVRWLLLPRCTAWVALAPCTTDAERASAVEEAQVLLDTPLVDRAPDVRVLRVGSNWHALRAQLGLPHGSLVYSLGTSRIATGLGTYNDQILEVAKDGRFHDFGSELPNERRATPIDLRRFLTGFVEAARANPARSWSLDLRRVVATDACLTTAEAALVLTGKTTRRTYPKDFLGPDLRKKLGLKVAEAEVARDRLATFSEDTIHDALEEGLPEDAPTMLRMTEPDTDRMRPIDRLSASLRSRIGASVSVPEDLAIELDRTIATNLAASQVLAAWIAPSDASLLKTVTVRGGRGTDQTLHETLTSGALGAFAQTFAFFQLATRRTNPIRRMARSFLDALRARLAEPNIVLEIRATYVEPSTLGALLEGYAKLLGAHLKTTASYDSWSIDAGAIRLFGGRYDVHVSVATSHWARVDSRILAALGTEPSGASIVASDCFALPYLLGDCDRLADSLSVVPEEDGFDADPRLSASADVDAIAKRFGLDRDSATHYLQLLTLREPTMKSVLAWNGWTSAEYDATVGKLVGAKLALEADRERAGRRLFLPGEWCKGDAKNLPYEGWKRGTESVQPGPHLRALPFAPLAALFARSRARIEAGDVPKFEEVR